MSIRVSELVANFLKYQKNIESCSDLTLKAYHLDLKQAFDFLDETKQKNLNEIHHLWDLARPALMKWGSLSLASRNRKIATLKSFFNYLYNEKLTDKNYASSLVCPQVPKKIPHFVSVDEVISILKYLGRDIKTLPAKKSVLAIHQKTLFLLLYGGGLRISEACHLKWNDVQSSQRRLLVNGKGSKQRFSILPAFCFEHLDRQPKDSIYVFGDEPLNPRAGYELIRNLGKEVGLMNPLHPHALRHSFATHLLASGANLRTLQSLLGHESLTATEKYTHLSVDHLARLIDQTHPLKKLKLGS